eukprot:4325607-Prymnesium_polylepis.1
MNPTIVTSRTTKDARLAIAPSAIEATHPGLREASQAVRHGQTPASDPNSFDHRLGNDGTSL